MIEQRMISPRTVGAMKRQDMINICVVDDHRVVHEGIRQMIAGNRDMMVTAEAGDQETAMSVLCTEACDVLILDISIPGVNGLDLLKKIRAAYPNLRILVFSMHHEDQYGIRALRAGAAGYLTKDCAAVQLVDAIRTIGRGRKYVSAALRDRLVFDVKNEGGKAPHELLSDREYQVLRMIGSGKSVTIIAAELHLSVKTVSTYRSRMLEKLQLKNNPELMRYAVKHEVESLQAAWR
jgi:two-component system, NarL family, invasion response regulator UvrY